MSPLGRAIIARLLEQVYKQRRKVVDRMRARRRGRHVVTCGCKRDLAEQTATVQQLRELPEEEETDAA